MSKIRTKDTVKNIKVLDKASDISRHMKDNFIRAKDNAENLSDDGQISPTEYAEDKIKYAAEDVVEDTGHAVSSGAKDTINKGKEAYRQHCEFKKIERTINNPAPNARQAETQAQRAARNYTKRYVSNTRLARNQTNEITLQTERSIKQSARAIGRASEKTLGNAVKTSQRAIKTAQLTEKAAIKTAQTMAKTAQKSAQTSAKAAKIAARAAQVAAKAAVAIAKMVAKALAATVKAILAGAKALVAAISAGGGVAILVIVIICLVALVVGSCFGIFFSSEDTGGQPMTEVVREINTEYDEQLESIKTSTAYNVLEMSGSRATWKEVLAIYAVKTTTDPDNPQDVASMTDGKKTLLRDVFWQMNVINKSTETKMETIIIESDDGHGNIVEEEVFVTQTYLYITVNHKSAEEMAAQFGFTASQNEQLAALLDDENNFLWTSVLYGVTGTDDQIVMVALSQLGNVGGEPYWSWYGFDGRIEWCGCFVSWCANECGYIDTGIIPKYANCAQGSNWFKERGQWAGNDITPEPGMVIFFDWNKTGVGQDGTPDHTGIVEKVENGRIYTVEGNSDGDTCREKSYPIGYYQIYGYGCPAY